MMRYPPPEMMASMGPNGMMMHQRPMGMDPQMMHYPAVGRESGMSEGEHCSTFHCRSMMNKCAHLYEWEC